MSQRQHEMIIWLSTNFSISYKFFLRISTLKYFLFSVSVAHQAHQKCSPQTISEFSIRKWILASSWIQRLHRGMSNFRLHFQRCYLAWGIDDHWESLWGMGPHYEIPEKHAMWHLLVGSQPKYAKWGILLTFNLLFPLFFTLIQC
jgi:hypothetical protein